MGWLKRLLQKRRDRGREIFRFFDGERERGADPIRVMRLIALDEEFVPERHLDPLLEGSLPDRDNEENIRISLAAARRIFGVKEWREDQPGLTEQETLQLWMTFATYLDALKKNGNPTPTSPVASDSPPYQEEDTSAMSDSTSTSTVSRQDEPVVS
jgi:hypothetical protein